MAIKLKENRTTASICRKNFSENGKEKSGVEEFLFKVNHILYKIYLIEFSYMLCFCSSIFTFTFLF